MAPELSIRLGLMQRRARLFSRQIAFATALTALAMGFVISALHNNGTRDAARDQRVSTLAP